MKGERILFAVDPGIRTAGASLFAAGRLVAAETIRVTSTGNTAAACVAMARELFAWARAQERPLLEALELNWPWEKTNLPHEPAASRPWIDEYVCEWPQIYTRDKSKGDPNDLIALAGVDAALAAMLHDSIAVSYLPADWKKQIDGDAMTVRILARLDQEETARIANLHRKVTDRTGASGGDSDPMVLKPGAHNAVDAIGIGLHHLGRLARQRLYAR